MAFAHASLRPYAPGYPSHSPPPTAAGSRRSSATATLPRSTLGGPKTGLWRWQERFAEEGVEGLLRDKTRPSRIRPLDQAVIDKVIALTATEPPHEATHWTAPAMVKSVGISASSVQRIWRAHGLAPHRTRHFKLSNDPDFVAKLRESSASTSTHLPMR